MDREGEIGGVIVRDVLHDHVHFDIGRADRAENLERHAGGVWHATDGQLGFIAVEGDAGNDRLFHGFLFIDCNKGARPLFEAVQNAQRDIVFAGEFDRTDLQHLGTEAGHFQHLFKGDLVEALGLRHDARISGVDAIDVGVDLALVRFQRRRQGNTGRVRATTPEGRDVAVFVDTLETGDHYHTTRFQVGADLLVVDLQDARLVVRAVGENTHLIAGVGHRRNATLHQGHRQQRDGDLLARGDNDIQLARNRLITDLPGQLDQTIGFTAHGRQHDHQVVTRLTEFLDLVGNLLDALYRAHGGAAKFLYD